MRLPQSALDQLPNVFAEQSAARLANKHDIASLGADLLFEKFPLGGLAYAFSAFDRNQHGGPCPDVLIVAGY